MAQSRTHGSHQIARPAGSGTPRCCSSRTGRGRRRRQRACCTHALSMPVTNVRDQGLAGGPGACAMVSATMLTLYACRLAASSCAALTWPLMMSDRLEEK